MAQTRRKRQTKHRGTAAGTVVARGRTGRPASPPDKKAQARAGAREARLARYDKPPTWGAIAKRSTIPAALLLPILLLARTPPAGAVALCLIAYLIYLPSGYMIDTAIYRRQLKRRRQAQASRSEERRR